MEEAIKAFKEMIEEDYAEECSDLAICEDGHCSEECYVANKASVGIYKGILESPEYQALINSIPPKEDKPDGCRCDNPVAALGPFKGLCGVCHKKLWPEEPKKTEKQYKLSEMWKVWAREADAIGCFDEDRFETLEEARNWARIKLMVPDTVVAITRADATEFYEGEGL